MSTSALSASIAPPARWSVTGCDDARAIKRPTPHSLPRSCLSRIAIRVATSQSALIDNRLRQRPGPDPITPARADAAKSP
jgi:hypothetical protein